MLCYIMLDYARLWYTMVHYGILWYTMVYYVRPYAATCDYVRACAGDYVRESVLQLSLCADYVRNKNE